MVSAKGRIFDNLLTEKGEYNQVAELLSDKNKSSLVHVRDKSSSELV